MKSETMKSVLWSLVLILIAVVSFMLIAGRASSIETHQANIVSIDEKADTVLRLSGTAALVSAGITAIPGDTATPIAEKLADFTGYFLVVLCILYAEKYLLTIIGAGVFRILIPIACGLGLVWVWTHRDAWKRIAVKLTVFGLALYFAIPISLRVSDQIYRAYSDSIEVTLSEAESLTGETSALTQTQDESLISAILEKISETVTSLSNKAVKTLNNYVQSLAVLIVTSCVIPVLVILFLIWLVKTLTNADNLFAFPYLPAASPFGFGKKKEKHLPPGEGMHPDGRFPDDPK